MFANYIVVNSKCEHHHQHYYSYLVVCVCLCVCVGIFCQALVRMKAAMIIIALTGGV